MGIALPGESAEYRAARDRLLEREIELRRAMEAVAAARRELPPGGRVKTDYVFQGAGADGAPIDVRLSELFEPGKDSLVIYSFMFPRDPGDQTPGPRERRDGAAAARRRAVPVVHSAAGPARRRGRACQPAPQPCGRREGAAAARSGVRPRAGMASAAAAVLRRQQLQRGLLRRNARRDTAADADRVSPRRRRDPSLLELGAVLRAPRIRGRSPATSAPLEPLWNLFDLTPEGRPADWAEQFSYP